MFTYHVAHDKNYCIFIQRFSLKTNLKKHVRRTYNYIVYIDHSVVNSAFPSGGQGGTSLPQGTGYSYY